MSLEDFVNNPWKKGSVHKAYESSFLHMRPAPEYASGEVLLASTYRNVGFSSAEVSEGKVPKLGREFQKRIHSGKDFAKSGVNPEAWRRIITGTLRSPKQPNQAAKRFLQISPVVPDASIYSLSARLSANSWNPGALVARVIQFGEPVEADAQAHWNDLFHALSVTEDDDIWARFLQQEFVAWRSKDTKDLWAKPRELTRDDAVKAWHESGVEIPATRFTKDFARVVSLKMHLTRRQWTSMLESVLRLGTSSHILWVCRANAECFTLMRDALEGKPVPDVDELKRTLGVNRAFWRYGQYSGGSITEAATSFIKARAGINLLLHQLQKTVGPDLDQACLANVNSISTFLEWLSSEKVRAKFSNKEFRRNYQGVIEADPRIVSGKKGISSNVKEFLQHALGQRQTAEIGLDSYDQGYYLAKKSTAKNSRWIVSLGPVSVLALVHSCTHGARGPRTIDNLCQHLGQYGIEIDAQEVADSKLGQTLRNLGLVLDSPDAEGGMVLINPFELMAKEAS